MAAGKDHLTNGNILLNSTDVVEFKTRKRSNTKWKSYSLTNVIFFFFWCFAEELLVLSEDGTLSELLNGRHSLSCSTAEEKTEKKLMTIHVPPKPWRCTPGLWWDMNCH